MAARSRTWLLLALALASGGLAAYLALRYLREQARPLLSQQKTSGKSVLASREIPIGTVVTERDVRVVDWPGDALPPGFISKPEDVIGRGVITPIRPNEPFLESKLAPKGAGGGLSTIIEDGMRALSVRVDEVIAVAGFVVPGTRVDVLLSMPDETTKEPVTRAILQNIEALASGQIIQRDPEGKPMPVSVVTVLVTPAQAETLALASQQGRIQMTLRSALDTTEITTTGARKSTLMTGEKRPVGPTRRAVVRAQQEAPRQTIVEGFEGGQKSIRTFANPSTP
jgi:pilus assembly protein CpaB